MKRMENNKSMRAQMIEMEPGQVLRFPLEAKGYSTIRGYASDLSFLYLRKYRTHRDKDARMVIVTREQ